MPTSEARIIANKANSAKSTGPKTVEGKERSRANGLKHGLTGQGVVIAEADIAEVDRRNVALQAELAPQSAMGAILVQQLATLSVRMERGARQEFASVGSRVRNAAEDFDASRVERAEDLWNTIDENPRGHVRKLLRMPEGVDLMVQVWEELAADLSRDLKNFWTASQMVTVANLLGLREEDARGSRIGALSRAIWGDFEGLVTGDGDSMNEVARRAWARSELLAMINAEIDRLVQHFETIDFTNIDLDRAEAGDRALFDPSKEASLARRYESEARRGFFLALKQFRQVEAEAAARPAPAPAPAPVPANSYQKTTSGPLASSWERPSAGPSEVKQPLTGFAPVAPSPLSGQTEVVREVDGRPLSIARPIPVA